MTTPPHLHELEAELMTELWRLGEGTARAVQQGLNARSERQRAYTTVLSVLTRLHVKGLLERRRTGRAHLYVPSLSQAEYRLARAGAEVDALVVHFGDEALAHFVHAVDELDPGRMRALRELAARPDDGAADA